MARLISGFTTDLTRLVTICWFENICRKFCAWVTRSAPRICHALFCLLRVSTTQILFSSWIFCLWHTDPGYKSLSLSTGLAIFNGVWFKDDVPIGRLKSLVFILSEVCLSLLYDVLSSLESELCEVFKQNWSVILSIIFRVLLISIVMWLYFNSILQL